MRKNARAWIISDFHHENESGVQPPAAPENTCLFHDMAHARMDIHFHHSYCNLRTFSRFTRGCERLGQAQHPACRFDGRAFGMQAAISLSI